VLDDLTQIHERDVQDALGVAEKEWQQLDQSFDIEPDTFDASNIVYAGMGGSALAAQMSLTWPGYDRPFEIVRSYDVPAYVSDKTYFIAASYSGNTEETISAVAQAAEHGAHIVVITSGGKLAGLAKEKGYALAMLPGGLQPRHAVFYNFKALIALLQSATLITDSDAEGKLSTAADSLRESVQAWVPTVATKDNRAKQIALECIGKSVVVYGGPKLYPAAYKWKISFNENAKHIAWVNQFSEFNHNEFLGWTKQPVTKPYTVIDLRSNLEHPRIQKRFEVTERLLSGMRPSPIVVQVEGQTILEQLLWVICLGDFVTIYTALLNGINPTPVDLIEKFKQVLAE
jgi:glucose/mannose-6-phosphate isomerase